MDIAAQLLCTPAAPLSAILRVAAVKDEPTVRYRTVFIPPEKLSERFLRTSFPDGVTLRIVNEHIVSIEHNCTLPAAFQPESSNDHNPEP